MRQANSAASKKIAPQWTVLTPLPLQGVGTSQVESLAYYLYRLSWTMGITQRHMAQQLGLGASRFLGLIGAFITTKHPTLTLTSVEKLEQLTGRNELRCGTLWALSNILSNNGGKVYRSNARRWCPKCYEGWGENSYEPLVWSIDLLACCPIHFCRLAYACPVCSKTQLNISNLDRRRICWSCGASLGQGAHWAHRTPFQVWVDEQVLYMVKYCATPRKLAVPYSVYSSFVSELYSNLRGRNLGAMRLLIQFFERGARFRSQRICIRSLINLCAVQGVSVKEVIGAPREAAGALLLDQWAGLSYLPIPTSGQARRIYVASRCLRDFMSKKPPYLPPMSLLLKRFNVQLLSVRDIVIQAYDEYEACYRKQGGRAKQLQLRRVFLCAQSVVASLQENMAWGLRAAVNQTANAAEVSNQTARTAIRSVLILLKTQTPAKIDKYEAEMPVREAMDWFIENRRFS